MNKNQMEFTAILGNSGESVMIDDFRYMKKDDNPQTSHQLYAILANRQAFRLDKLFRSESTIQFNDKLVKVAELTGKQLWTLKGLFINILSSTKTKKLRRDYVLQVDANYPLFSKQLNHETA